MKKSLISNARVALERAFNKYDDEIIDIAEKVFSDIVKPYLVKNGLTMLVGNGSYYIYD